MQPAATFAEPTSRRRVFPGWSIEVPDAFEEDFVFEGAGYWHAWDKARSVSLTSIILAEEGRPVSARRIIEQTSALADGGTRVHAMPPGRIGWAFTARAEPGSRASRLISGGIAVDGLILLATVTADDADWAMRTWLSIRSHPRGH